MYIRQYVPASTINMNEVTPKRSIEHIQSMTHKPMQVHSNVPMYACMHSMITCAYSYSMSGRVGESRQHMGTHDSIVYHTDAHLWGGP